MGQDESTPRLPKNKDSLVVSDVDSPCLPYLIPEDLRIKSIEVKNSEVTSFPLRQTSVKRISIDDCCLIEVEDALKTAEFDFPLLEVLRLRKAELTIVPNAMNKFTKMKELNEKSCY